MMLLRSLPALAALSLCLSISNGANEGGNYKQKRNYGQQKQKKPSPTHSDGSAFSSSFSAMSLGTFPLAVSQLKFCHGYNRDLAGGRIAGDRISIQFKEGTTPGGVTPTVYDSAMEILVGNGQHTGVIQKLARQGFTQNTVSTDQLREAFQQTAIECREYSKWDPTLDVFNSVGPQQHSIRTDHNYSNNNRTLYALNMVDAVFPNAHLQVPCKPLPELSGVHRRSDATFQGHCARKDKGSSRHRTEDECKAAYSAECDAAGTWWDGYSSCWLQMYAQGGNFIKAHPDERIRKVFMDGKFRERAFLDILKGDRRVQPRFFEHQRGSKFGKRAARVDSMDSHQTLSSMRTRRTKPKSGSPGKEKKKRAGKRKKKNTGKKQRVVRNDGWS